MKSKIFWYTLMTGSLALYVLLIIAGRMVFPDSTLLSMVFVAAMFLLHLSEIPHARSISCTREISLPVTIVMTILFGFTWWLPLKKGVL